MNIRQKLDYRNMHPFTQGIIAMSGSIFIALICLMCQRKGMLVWNLLTAPVLFYCIYNPVLGILRHEKKLRYTGFSVLTLVLIFMFTLFTGNLLSIYSYAESIELHSITVLLVLFFLLLHFLSFVYQQILLFLKQLDD